MSQYRVMYTISVIVDADSVEAAEKVAWTEIDDDGKLRPYDPILYSVEEFEV